MNEPIPVADSADGPTILVQDLKDKVNAMIDASWENGAPQEGREALKVLISDVLMDADEYRGFEQLSLYDESAVRYF